MGSLLFLALLVVLPTAPILRFVALAAVIAAVVFLGAGMLGSAVYALFLALVAMAVRAVRLGMLRTAAVA